MSKNSNTSPSKNKKVIRIISKILKTTYLIIKAALMAFFFMYVIAILWFIPFDILMPQHFDQSVPTTLLGRVIVGLSFLMSFLAVTFYINRYQKELKSLLPSPPSTWKVKAKGFVIISILTFLALTIILSVTMALGIIDFQITEGYFPFTHFFQSLEFTFFAGILTYFFVALAEEMVYRGLLFRYLFKNTSNVQFALIISSLIFSLLHFNETPLFYITAFLIGYLLALTYYHTGSLLYCISIHWTINIFMFLGKNYLDDYLNMQSQTISGWGDYSNLIKIPFLILIILSIHIFMKKNKAKKKKRMKNQAIA